MNREIKFRFWLSHTKRMTHEHTLDEIPKIIPEFTSDIIPLQYTGLKDKNGKEIYEGDVFGKLPQMICVVEKKEDGAYVLRFAHEVMKGKEISILNRLVVASVVQGNIYENPELLNP